MSVEQAKNYFLGAPERKHFNCAQAVVKAFQDKYSLSDELVAQCGSCGRGMAPDGVCGAFFAAKTVLEPRRPEKVRELESAFAQRAGSTKCAAIRAARRLSCLGCVEISAKALE